MSNLNPYINRTFLAWDKPLGSQAAAWFAKGWEKSSALDLSDQLVIVMTAQAGRRLREALACYAGAYGQAVYPPVVVTSDQFMSLESKAQVATKIQSLMTWTRVLLKLNPENYPHLFPAGLQDRDFTWAHKLANTIYQLQGTLSEAGLRMADIASVASAKDATFIESARWGELGELESKFDALLAEQKVEDARAVTIRDAFSPQLTTRYSRIVVLANPDPLPLALIKLEHLSEQIPVEIVVYAPSSESNTFDRFGRPLVVAWQKRDVSPAPIAEYVHAFLEPHHQVDHIIDWVKKYQNNTGFLTIGVADQDLSSLLEGTLRRENYIAFNPVGRPISTQSLYYLLTAIRDLEKNTLFSTVESLIRIPEFGDYLKEVIGEEFLLGSLLKKLDQLKARCLPVDLQSAQMHAVKLDDTTVLIKALGQVELIRHLLINKQFKEAALQIPQIILRNKKYELYKSEDRQAQDSAIAWTRIVKECSTSGDSFKSTQLWDIALSLFASEQLTEEKPVSAIELHGWLDLLWEDAPHLVVAGMNDGRVPNAITSDAFLPESLRCLLGLRSNQDRYVTDAYILKTLHACRSKNGRLDLLFGKRSLAGDPLRPTRLLFQCDDDQLAERVEYLFKDTPSSEASQAWRRAWQISIPHPLTLTQENESYKRKGLNRVSVTGLRSWLKCPFRFYLEKVLKMSPVEVWRNELSESTFGTLCHDALDAMGKNEIIKQSCNEKDISDFLNSELDRLIHSTFGNRLSLPLMIQSEAAHQRLSHVAKLQAQERSDGWLIVTTEKTIEVEVAGLVVSGKIDRIEKNEVSKKIRVIDYKTSDKAKTPRNAHIASVKKDTEHSPLFSRFGPESQYVWIDLQLPIYREALKREFGDDIQLGYFNLPKAATDSAIDIWDDYTEEVHQAALICAEGVCKAIKAGEYWPPNENYPERLDEFAQLFSRGVTDSIKFSNGGKS